MQIILEGHDQPVPVRAGDTMLEALLRAGVACPSSGQAGNCGTCKCELVWGDILELEHSEHALAPEQRAKGIILACRTQVWDDAVIRRIDAEDLVMHPSRVMRCRVLQLEALTHDIRGVHLAIEAGGPLTFSAGQYAQLEFAPGLSRHYSMANTPEDRKSTRLNSSHGYISYAVFCLKKKKHTNRGQRGVDTSAYIPDHATAY